MVMHEFDNADLATTGIGCAIEGGMWLAFGVVVFSLLSGSWRVLNFSSDGKSAGQASNLPIECRTDSVKNNVAEESPRAMKHFGRTNLYHVSQNTR